MQPSLHPDISYQILKVGNEQQPLIIVDNFLANAGSLIDYAMQQGDVTPATGFYPGMRSVAPQLYSTILMDFVQSKLMSIFDVEASRVNHCDSYFSMVTTAVEELSPMQKVPHFDQPNRNELAVIHYLCDESHGGTALYRHRQTGFEFIDQVRVGQYLSNLEQQIQQQGLPNAYMNGDSSLFEQIHSVEAKFNRLVIYRCSSLHSGNIPADYAYDMNPRTGRFTIASFLYNK